MNILIGLLPALFWGILPLCVARIGGKPTQQIMGTTLGTLIIAMVLYVAAPSHWGLWSFVMSFLSGACWAFG